MFPAPVQPNTVIYTKRLGSHWTLRNANGNCVNLNGDLAYVPLLFDEKPVGYPVYEERKK
jgi:hypothetical protein